MTVSANSVTYPPDIGRDPEQQNLPLACEKYSLYFLEVSQLPDKFADLAV